MTVLTLFGQPTPPPGSSGLIVDTTAYTLGVQFTVSEDCSLTAVWFYSTAGAGIIPFSIDLYNTDGTLIHSEIATWSGSAGSGWIRAGFSTPPSLTASVGYKACITSGDTGGQNWYSATSHYWDSGDGSLGITNGILHAPNDQDSAFSIGQDSFFSPSGYPNNSFNATNYWLDPEVTTSGSGTTGTSAVTFKKMTSAGSGTAKLFGTSAVTFKKMTSAGVATVTVTGASAITFKKMTSAGVVTVKVTGTSAVTFRKMTSAGAGKVKIFGTSAVTFKKIQAHGSSAPRAEASSMFIFSPLF